MKRVIFFIVIAFSSLVFAQNLYFSEPTSSHIDYIGPEGLGPIAYSMYTSNGWLVSWWRAKLKDPDGNETAWMYGRTGGWWVSVKLVHTKLKGKRMPGCSLRANIIRLLVLTSLLASLIIMHRQYHRIFKFQLHYSKIQF